MQGRTLAVALVSEAKRIGHSGKKRASTWGCPYDICYCFFPYSC